MLRNCKIVLKGLRKIANGQSTDLAFLGETTCICRLDDYSIKYDYAKYENEISSIVSQLGKDGYLEFTVNEYHFVLTQKGLHPYAFQWESIKEFLLKSVAIPVIVALITTLITLWLQSLL